MTENKTARPESLEQVFLCYTKDNLQDIAKKHGLKGFSKWNKKDLAKWLKDQLLDENVMGEIVKKASADETGFFEAAIREQGIQISQDLVAASILLATYGAYDPKQSVYLVPDDVEEQYEKICTPDMQAEKANRDRMEIYAKAAAYLYGVISVEKFAEICETYDEALTDVEEVRGMLEEICRSNKEICLKDGLLMFSDLSENNVYQEVQKVQGSFEYYIPKTEEEFVNYGRLECQEPNENTVFFIQTMMFEFHKNQAEALQIFYEVQDSIRMNFPEEEIISQLYQHGCYFSSQKQVEATKKEIRRLGCMTRCWDYKGHMESEVTRNAMSVGLGRKVYPNEPCPCGSGKKYKRCCGRKG